MKRYVEELVSLYEALLLDAACAFPALEAEFKRDLIRLTRLSNNRGLPFWMVDLPALGKHLDRCLSNGKYIPSGLPASQPVGGGVGIPKLFRGLYLLVFDGCGNLKEGANVEAIFFLRQFLYCAKKASVDCSDRARRDEIAAFVETDTSLPIPAPAWENPASPDFALLHQGFSSRGDLRQRIALTLGECKAARLLQYLDRVAGVIATTLGAYEPLEWRFRHGPGAVSDCRSGDNRFQFRNWSDRLESEFPIADVAHHDYFAWVDEALLDRRSSIEPASRLMAVKKTLTKPRLIASEPSEHMWCQQNIRDYMYARCAKSWINAFIDFRSQKRNQDLAKRGSLDGSLATIDLSAASDRVSCHVVGDLFRANPRLLRSLAATRTRRCIVSDELTIEVRKYSTMGNATTFPVQSLIFLAVALSCKLDEDNARSVTPQVMEKYGGLVSVFGDDIIVPNSIVRDVICLLEALGFKVNTAKSYMEGFFRESCGVDAFRGVDVTPAYWQGPCDKTPESIASTIEVANNFYKKFLVHASARIERSCRIRFPYKVVGSGASGFESFCVPPIDSSSRWNKGLQRAECLVPTFTSEQRLEPVEDNTSLLQFFTEDPSPMDPWRAGVRLRPLLKIKKRWVPTAQLLTVE